MRTSTQVPAHRPLRARLDLSPDRSGPGPSEGGPRPRSARGRAARRTLMVVVPLVVAAAVALLLGERDVPVPGIRDAGPLNESVLLLARAVSEVAAVGTVGVLLVMAALVPADLARDRLGRLGTVAGRWAAVWAAASVVLLLVTCAEIVGVGVVDLIRSGGLPDLVAVPAARALVSTTAVALVVAVGARGASRLVAQALLVLALAGLVPPLLTSHLGHGEEPGLALAALVVHVPAVALWVGGLLALVLHGRGPALGPAMRRFSPMAGVCLAIVALSGAVTAAGRLTGLDDLWSTPYGSLVVVKLTALGVLGAFGGMHRARTLPALQDGRPRALLRLASLEVVVMAATVGVAVGLSTTAPPV